MPVPLRFARLNPTPRRLGGGSSLDAGAHRSVHLSTRLDRPAAVRHPLRFAHLNPTSRRLGAARVWTLVRIEAFIFPHDLTGQPQCGIHFIGAGQVSDTPRVLRRAARRFRDTAHCHVDRTQKRTARASISRYSALPCQQHAEARRLDALFRILRRAARRYGARPIVFSYYITDCGHMDGFFV